jgi:DUF4097 and DUF4098 domain-containing protein YvlB
MTVLFRALAALIVIGITVPASAQNDDWIGDVVGQAAQNMARDLRIAVLEAVAQGGRAAARAAAQAEREAERRRRQEERNGPEVTEKFSRTVRLGRDGTFSLENVSGEIQVTGGAGNDVRIDATKRVRHSDPAEARALLQALTIEVSERGGNVDVRTEFSRARSRRNWSGGVDFVVTVPREASISLRSISGTIKVNNVNGEVRAETVSGDVVTTGGKKIRTIKAVSGDVQISDAESDDLSVGMVSGDVVIRNLKARFVGLQSVSGDLRLSDVDADHAEMRTVSGNLEYSGRLSRSGRYDLQTHSGNVRVTPVGSPNFSLEATTFSGDVRSDLPLVLQGQSLDRGFARRNRSVRGTFGSGGAMLTLQSFSGNIVINKQ